MNNHIDEHPVDRLAQSEFDGAANWAHAQLDKYGHAFVDLQPGDATTYKIVVVRPTSKVEYPNPTIDWDANMWVGTSFGPLYPWRGNTIHWDYAASKWTSDNHEWTGRVIARFLTTLAQRLGDK
jgi:hypothetical protein